MTIYRTSERYPRSDVHAYEPVVERLAPRIKAPQISVERDEHQHLRKAAPANRPLPSTLMWVASLPSNVQPTALLSHYARIANLTAATWGNPKSFDAYTESLLTDKRGNRRGFPPEVLSEWVGLQRYRDTLSDDNSAWTIVRKRG